MLLNINMTSSVSIKEILGNSKFNIDKNQSLIVEKITDSNS